jgi:hypothetical protein
MTMPTMMTMTKKKRSERLFARVLLTALLLAAATAQAGTLGAPGQKRLQPYALLVGTVFYEETGFLVRGARVQVRLKDTKKHWEANTNDAGEFAIQLPVGKAVYLVQAEIAGHQPDSKEVEVEKDERVDIVLHLKGK